MATQHRHFTLSLLSLSLLCANAFAASPWQFSDGKRHDVSGSYHSETEGDIPLSASQQGTEIVAERGRFSTKDDRTSATAVSAGATLSLNNVNVQTQGALSHGIVANAATVNVHGGSIATQGQQSNGISAIRSTLTILEALTINHAGPLSRGIYLEDSQLTAKQGLTITSDGGMSGLHLVRSRAVLEDVVIALNNPNGFDALRIKDSDVEATQLNIRASGNTVGIVLDNDANHAVHLKDSTLNTEKGVGLHIWKGAAQLDDVVISSEKNSALYVDGNGKVEINNGNYTSNMSSVMLTPGASLVARGGEFTTTGDGGGANVINAMGRVNLALHNSMLIAQGNRSTALYSESASTGSGLTIQTLGKSNTGVMAARGGNIQLTDSAIYTEGEASTALAALLNSTLRGKGVDLAVAGDASTALRVRDGGAITLADSQINATGREAVIVNATGFHPTQASTVTLNNTQADASQGRAVNAEGARLTLNLLNGTQLSGKEEALYAYQDKNQQGSDVDINAADNALITGNLRADSLSRIALTLSNNAVFNGATDNVQRVTIDNSSRWLLSGHANVGELSLSGDIIFQPDSAGFKTLTVNQSLTGNGTFTFNTQLGDDNSPTDRLHVKGSAQGNYQVIVKNQGGKGAIPEKGIPLILVEKDASAANFTQQGEIAIDHYEYFLNKVNANEWYLQASYNPNPVDPVNPVDPIKPVDPVTPGDPEEGDGNGEKPNPTPKPKPKPQPTLRREIAGYQISPWLNAQYAFTAAGNWHQRQSVMQQGQSAWGRVVGQYDRLNSGRFDYQSKTFFMQLGGDLWQGSLTDTLSASAGVIGTLGHINTQAADQARQLRAGLATDTGTLQTQAFGVGGYVTLITPQGAYLDTVLQETLFRTDFHSASQARQNSNSTLLSVEWGMPLPLSNAFTLVPQLQATGQWLHSGATGAAGVNVKQQDQALGLARAGLRLGYHAANAQPFVQLDVLQRMGQVKGANMDGLSVAPDLPTTWWKASAGISHPLTDNVNIYGQAEYQRSFTQQGLEGYSGHLGMKVSF